MAKKSKRYRKNFEKVPAAAVPVAEAVKIIKSFETGKFDATVELVLSLGIDTKQADQQLRGAVTLPHGIGATRKVIAFCDGEDMVRAKAAGAIEAGSDELVKKVQDGWTDFDIAISTQAMMKIVSRLGRVLGPQGKMPSPKAGTVVTDIAKAVGEFVAGKAEFRSDDGGNVHGIVGKISFDEQKLAENTEAFIAHMRRIRPPTSKGTYFKKVCLCTTMSPSVQLAV